MSTAPSTPPRTATFAVTALTLILVVAVVLFFRERHERQPELNPPF